MKTRILTACFAVLLLMATSTGSVFAHANWLHGNLKNNQVFTYGHTPKQIQGFFAERLVPNQSWMAIFEGVADHGLLTEKDHSYVNYKNPKEMILPLTHTKLAREKYYLIWYTHSAEDGHYAAGILYFQVK
jgi:methionine-rich copper-binding protein CopC